MCLKDEKRDMEKTFNKKLIIHTELDSITLSMPFSVIYTHIIVRLYFYSLDIINNKYLYYLLSFTFII